MASEIGVEVEIQEDSDDDANLKLLEHLKPEDCEAERCKKQVKGGRRNNRTITFHACDFPNCKETFDRKWKFLRHLCTHTGQRPFQCRYEGCQKTYQSSSHLQRHTRVSHCVVQIRLACSYGDCKVTFTCKSSLMKHLKSHQVPRAYKCTMCEEAFTRPAQLTKHELKAHDVKPYKCTLCPSSFTSASHLMRHTRDHGKSYPCIEEGCDQVFESRLSMRKHYRRDHRKVLTCEHCQKPFNNKAMLREHLAIHVSAEQRTIICCPHAPCKRFYYQMRNLTHHIKVFHNVARYYCPVKDCSSAFKTQEARVKHVKRHHGKRRDRGEKDEIIEQLLALQSGNLFSEDARMGAEADLDKNKKDEEASRTGDSSDPLDLSYKELNAFQIFTKDRL